MSRFALAVGILKKPSEAVVQRPRPPPPPPPQAAKNGKPVIPPKPKRGIPPPGQATTPVAEGEKLRDVRFADEDEPTTEDSYDYKDLDFVSDIFDFRTPPPRPRPPHPKPTLQQQANGDVRRTILGVTEKSLPLQAEEHAQDDVGTDDDRIMSVEADILPRDDIVAPMEEDDDDDDSDGKVDDLAIFLQEHEGKELTLEDVRQLERLLDAAEKAEAGITGDAADDDHADEDRERTPAVRFGTAEILDDGILEDSEKEEEEDVEELAAEIPQQAADEPRTDYNSTVEFHQESILLKGRQTSVDSGTYEPVGPPDLRFVRPDLSGYVPPQPSPRIGDPFSWRRRGKRRHDRYGYETIPFGSTKAPARNRILDGCQKLELYIASRHLGPPGMLLSTLGNERRRKRKAVDSLIRPPPRRPPPPVPPKISTSPLPSQENDAVAQSNTQDDDTLKESPFEDEMAQIALEAELEKQIWVELSPNEAPVVQENVQVENAPSTVSQVPTDLDSATMDAEVVEPVAVKVESYQTGDSERNAEEVKNLEDNSRQVEEEENHVQKDCVEVERPKRASRRDGTSVTQRSWQVPCRPERRKRVASAEPPLTAFGLEREQESERAPPRRKPKRSASFHTAEEIRRKIDAQAQHFLRTPRRKERSSTEYLAACPSASASLTYGTLRRKGRALTPVYSHVDKSALRRKEAAVQAPSRGNSLEGQEGLEENHVCQPESPVPPPKIPEVDWKIVEKPEDDEHVESKEDEPCTVVNESFQAQESPTELPGVQEETSKVPREFESLKSPEPEVDINVSPSSPATRPLPPPPPPPRRKHAAAMLSKELLASGSTPVVFCGIFPKDDGCPSGKMTVIPRMKVIELSVVRLEASHLRVSQLDADHLKVSRTTLEDRQESPLPPKPSGGDGEGSAENGDQPADEERKRSTTEDEQESLPNISENQNHEEVPRAPPSDSGSSQTDTVITAVPLAVVNGPILQDTEEEFGDDGWTTFDPENQRLGCESPLGTLTSTTSGSASYVTCDETLHLDDVDDGDVGFDNGLELSDTDIGEDFVSELEDDDGPGCPTPTEREAPSVPDALLSPTAPSYLSSFLALSPSVSFPSSDSCLASPTSGPISRNAASADMDENFNLWNPESKNVVHDISHSQGTDDISRLAPDPDQSHEASVGGEAAAVSGTEVPKVGNPHESSCQKPDESG